MNTNTTILESKGIGKSFRGRKVLKDVSIEVKDNETVGLLGPNGAGKTTSFYILAGLIKPNQGKITFNGKDITSLSIDERAKLGICLLPQERSIFTALSVIDNVKAVLEIQGEPRKNINNRALEYLAEMGIEHLAKQASTSLSGGEVRRLEIARTLVMQPKVLLLDEPFAAIDPITVADLQVVLKKLCDSGISIVISDHNVRETLSSCDRGYILLDGKVLCSGTPAELANDERVRTHYLGSDFAL